MDGQIYIARGDLSQLAAHAVGFSTDTLLHGGMLYPSFEANLPGFATWFQEQRSLLQEPAQIGESFWYPTESAHRPYGVVVVPAAGGPATTQDKAAIAVRAAIDTAVSRLRERLGARERILLGLPMFRTGMGGDHDDLMRTARAQLGQAMATLSRHPGVDVAFLAFTPTIYRIFLEARRELEPAPAEGDRGTSELERALVQGHCVPFLGAGMSRGAGLPDWSELIAVLAGALDLKDAGIYDPLDLAQWYRERFGKAALAEVVSGIFSGSRHEARPTLAHYMLLGLPIRMVLTTNYDDLVERALLGLKRYPVRVVREADVARTALDQGISVVKFHGDAVSAADVVLCRDDYEEFFERRPAMSLLLRGLLLNHTLLFVGYSLRDPNFRSIFGEVGRMLRDARRPAFATTFEAAGPAGPLIEEQWRQKNLRLIPIGGDDSSAAPLLRFLDRLSERIALRHPHPILAPDAEVPPALRALRETLGGELAREVERLCQANVDEPPVIRHLAEVLGFLTRLGWRPGGRRRYSLSGYWEKLAKVAADPIERHRWLVAALDVAENHLDAERIRQKLDRQATRHG